MTDADWFDLHSDHHSVLLLVERDKMIAETTMSPLEIRMLLHFHISFEEYDGIELHSESWKSAIHEFLIEGLIDPVQTAQSNYKLTDRGIAYVKSITNMPLPEDRRVWVDGYGNTIKGMEGS